MSATYNQGLGIHCRKASKCRLIFSQEIQETAHNFPAFSNCFFNWGRGGLNIPADRLKGSVHPRHVTQRDKQP